jgi:DNA-binding SARP family transcriptional activator
MIDVTMLGRISLQRAGPDTDAGDLGLEALLTRSKPLAVLAYLLLGTERGSARRDEIAGLLWPDLGRRRGRAALSQALYVLRRAMGRDHALAGTVDVVGVDPSAVRCDALAFRAALDEGRYEDAMACYGGELLPSLHVDGAPAFDRWLRAERAAFAALAVQAAWHLAELSEKAGNLAAAGHWARRAAQVRTHDPDDARKAVRMLERLGDPQGAAAILAAAEVHEALAGPSLGGDAPGDGSEGGGRGRTASATSPGVVGTGLAGRSQAVRAIPSRRLMLLTAAALAAVIATAALGPWRTEGPAIDAEPPSSLWLAGLEASGTMSDEEAERATHVLRAVLAATGLPVVLAPPADALLPPDSHVGAPASDASASGMSASARDRGDGARWLLTGDLATEGPSRRLTLRAFEQSDGSPRSQRWATTFRAGGQPDPLFYSSLAHTAGLALAPLVGVEPETLRPVSLTPNAEAFEAWADGRFLTRTADSTRALRAATERYAEAIGLDPSFAAAYRERAWARMRLALRLGPGAAEAEAGAIRADVEAALALDSTDAVALALQGWVRYALERDWDRAERSFSQALELDPNAPAVHALYPYLLLATGRREEGLRISGMIARSAADDPKAWVARCRHLFLAARFEAAMQACGYARRLSAADLDAPDLILAAAIARTPVVARGALLDGLDPVGGSGVELGSAVRAALEARAAPALAVGPPEFALDSVRALHAAEAYALLGERDHAFAALQRAADAFDPLLPEVAMRPWLADLREDPRFAKFLEALGLPAPPRP